MPKSFLKNQVKNQLWQLHDNGKRIITEKKKRLKTRINKRQQEKTLISDDTT